MPPAGLLSDRYIANQPYIYSDAEIHKDRPNGEPTSFPRGIERIYYATIFGLLSVPGWRVNEVLALDLEDVNLDDGVLSIRRTKFGKSRLIPLHDSTRQVLIVYARERDRIVRQAADVAFFVSESGTRVTQWATRYNFAKISAKLASARR